MFWTSEVFHPVWMPLEARRRNWGTPVMDLQSKSECTFIKELITAAWRDLTTLRLYLYGSFNLVYGCCIAEKGGSILPATACCCHSSLFLSLVLTLPFYRFSYFSAGSVPWSGSQLSRRTVVLAQGRQQEQALVEGDAVPAVTYAGFNDPIIAPCCFLQLFSTPL